ncbi:iron ABC transporter permease [uncultured Cetobacterium sp.]|uniref:FecCD family ABC transporter permease n=1 Tax=uncultured Cetobacterium sp. TaxID=527638 RepID=UPI0026338919|nr:iron ABC transporter permease [uncultured Cetobacterium sp.]
MKSVNTHKIYIYLFLILIITLIISLCIGSVNIPLSKIFNILKYNIFSIGEIDRTYNGILWYIRTPRVLTAFLVGGGLGICGATIQSLFQNPMGDPGILGISSGARLGAILSIAFGLASKSIVIMPLMSIFFSFLAGILVYKLGTFKGKVSILGLILSGIAIRTFLGALNSLILTNISDNLAKEFLFWSMGSLSGRHWDHIYMAGVPILFLSYLLMRNYNELNILLLGDEQSLSLGINVNRFRKKILIYTSSIVALAVCISGNIGFVGLVIPHILKKIIGNDNKYILPMSFLGGGIFLLLADLISRIIISPKEIGIGIVTSLLGAPYFMYLLLKYRRGEN